MVKIKASGGFLNRYLTVEVQIDNTKIILNDGQSMNKKEVDELVSELKEAVETLESWVPYY